jgi:hypothetical protein
LSYFLPIFLTYFLQLAADFEKSVPVANLLPVLRQILVEQFNATPKSVVSA